jgi:uncharacterized protein (TIGR00725 family)
MNIIIGVMGPGEEATSDDLKNAYLLGKFIAKQNWVLLTGGRNKGVMHSASKGAKENNGVTIGILPGDDYSSLSEYVDIPVITGMGNARNNINILSSIVVVACGIGPGTISEIALAIKARKNVILLNDDEAAKHYFKKLCNERIHIAVNIDKACALLIELVQNY